jgi:hypothetical protein
MTLLQSQCELHCLLSSFYSPNLPPPQGLMRTEGAVLRQLAPSGGGGGSSSEAATSSPWRVLLKDGRSDNFIQVCFDALGVMVAAGMCSYTESRPSRRHQLTQGK